MPLAVIVDDTQRQPHTRKQRRYEGWWTPSLVRVHDDLDVRLVFLCLASA